MTLPEPNFIERDIDKITQEWVSYYESRTGKTLEPAQVERILIDLGVYRENLLRIKIQETAKQNLVDFAEYPFLDYLGELVGVKRIDAQKASVTLEFTVLEAQNFNILIPKNTQVETKDGKFIFETQADISILAGETTAQIKAISNIAGSEANGYLVGEINNLITPLPYIGEVQNVEISQGGADQEAKEQHRERIKQAPERFSNAGSKGAYRFHTMSAHPSIIDVSVVTKQAGVVQIYPLAKDGNPTNEIIERVQEYLTDEKIRPLTDLVIVSSPEKVDFEINAEVTLYNFADRESIETQIEQKIEEYKASLKSKLGKDIVPTQIIAFLNSIYGVYKVELNTPYYQELGTHQWANLAYSNVNIGGYAND